MRSKPKESITGTVSNEVPPVTTLMAAVKKNAATKQSKPTVLTHPRVANLPARFQFAAAYNFFNNPRGIGTCYTPSFPRRPQILLTKYNSAFYTHYNKRLFTI
jgi:hypothetical protein